MSALNLLDQRFGSLTVTSRSKNSPLGKSHWLCTCDCGTRVVVRGTSLTSGNTHSCGCLRAQLIRLPRTETPGIRGAHDRIVARRGRASNFTCVDCASPARDWSYTYDDPEPLTAPDGAPYSLDVSRYVPRCRPCHKQHDLNFDVNTDGDLQEHN